ncbi:hypothetical protein OB955_10120 [Halobacteria archaeon AArc-m2/3/4]|uniref:DUF8108 domain-containing protein n=1 Tax=Natronoglomus mannanivorans TaxID=2979990 RepID=A0ABT2QDV1_9EURY|nr:hypothetical protein [Halobacteria archaeon AArc-m2/3/4]
MSDRPSHSDDSPVVALADTVSEILYGIAGWLLVGLGLAISVLGPPSAAAGHGIGFSALLFSTVAFVLGLVFVAFGVFVNPSLRRRLNRRHKISRFGTVRTVDQRVVRPDERCLERCVSCDSRVERGMVRRYREEYALAGVPVYTASVDYNHYCLECATDELSGRHDDALESRSPFEGSERSTALEEESTDEDEKSLLERE